MVWRALNGVRPCACGEAVQDCDFWQAVFQRAFGTTDRERLQRYDELMLRVCTSYTVRSRRPFRTAAYERDLRQYRDLLSGLYAAIAAVSGARTIVDSSKIFGYGDILTRLPGLDVAVLDVVRDSRAVAFSWGRGTTSSVDLAMPRLSPRPAALRWARDTLQAERLAGRVRRYRRVRYEDFVAAPAAVLGSLGVYYDLRTPPVEEGNVVELAATHMVRGNPNRFQTGAVPIRLDDEWRTVMSAWDASQVTLLTWPLLLRYGYPLRPAARQATATM
jgi:hypothetical protein